GEAGLPAGALKALGCRRGDLLSIRVFALHPKVNEQVLVDPRRLRVSRPNKLLIDCYRVLVERLRLSKFSLKIEVAAQIAGGLNGEGMSFAQPLPQGFHGSPEQRLCLIVLLLDI